MSVCDCVRSCVCVCVLFQPEDSGREYSVCEIFSQLGERSHQTPRCQICPHWGDIQPVTMAAACSLLDPAKSSPLALSIILALNILSAVCEHKLKVCFSKVKHVK